MSERIRQGTPAYDQTQQEKQLYNNNASRITTSVAAKEAVQNLYKIQLDACMLQKQMQRQNEKQKIQEQKRDFNVQAEKGKEAERMKQASYKNYYNMVMGNQTLNKEAYVSPFLKRQNMKETLVNKNVEQERKKYELFDIESRKRQQEKRFSYKNQLLNQIQERKKRESLQKNEQVKQKKYFQENFKFPEEIRRYEKEKIKEQKQKYRDDLDKVKETRYRSQSNTQSANFKPSTEYHNILTNPMPYNIQNPYIIQQMGAIKNQSYLATKGSQNLKLS